MSWLRSRWTIFVIILLMAITTYLIGMSMSAVPLSDKESDALIEKLMVLDLAYDPADVKLAWLDGWRNTWGEKHGLCASYRMFSDTVVIPRYQQGMYLDSVMFTVYAHELKHAEQRHRMGIPIYLFCKTFRRGMLEREAVAEESKVEMVHGVKE